MIDKYEAVHVHRVNMKALIEEYRQKGFVLKEETKPTIIAQAGFVKLIFEPMVPAEPTPQKAAYVG